MFPHVSRPDRLKLWPEWMGTSRHGFDASARCAVDGRDWDGPRPPGCLEANQDEVGRVRQPMGSSERARTSGRLWRRVRRKGLACRRGKMGCIMVMIVANLALRSRLRSGHLTDNLWTVC